MLGITGKDENRVHELLLRGTLVSGASRFRWTGWAAEVDDLRVLVAGFPGDDPERPFQPDRCVRAVLRGGRRTIDVPREAGTRRPLLRKTSFWDILMDLAASGELHYSHYSYKDRADCYKLDMSLADIDKLRAAGEVLKYSSLREQIQSAGFISANLYVER